MQRENKMPVQHVQTLQVLTDGYFIHSTGSFLFEQGYGQLAIKTKNDIMENSH